MKEPAVLKSLAALSQAHRLRVFRALVVAGKSGSTPTNIAGRIKVSPATLSFHLKELLNAGLISQQRSGRNLIYRADFQRMNDVLAYLTENCCQGEKCIQPASEPVRPGPKP
jgi:ArsR family transcriptional regulator, arsenate/arsenite/antimonite-responsive transcriptional repressor